ncbi:four helix bundle protein [bacterium]|nr:four helix bundle protein [candidate division CSSED10-310 bacterium]
MKVYQQAVDFAEAIMTATAEFPGGYRSLADQLNRASTCSGWCMREM